MANKIKILSDLVANQIAAGEVVERPASVLKELIENSLDAGATVLEIDIQDAGSELIRVADNGEGMNHDDALLCLERHGTSKVDTLEDVAAVKTYGFRGEAIPSIAAVSDFKIRTCQLGANSGTEVIVRGGRLLEAKECGCPPGTAVEVRRLFHNTPARKKFLKTPATEMAHMERFLRIIALAHPKVSINVRVDNKPFCNWPATTASMRLAEVLGSDIFEELVPIDVTSPEGWRLHGWASRHDYWHISREHIHWLVNLRPVTNRALEHALREAYRGGITAGRYPVIVLHLSMSPEEVDVNVHPAKLEVRFRHETRLRHWLADALSNALVTAIPRNLSNSSRLQIHPPNEARGTEGAENQEAKEVFSNNTLLQTPSNQQTWHHLSEKGSPGPFKKSIKAEPVFTPSRTHSPPTHPVLVTPPPRHAGVPSGPILAKSPQLTLPPLPQNENQAPNPVTEANRKILKIRLTARVRFRYWIGETDNGLVLIDQLAAHQRIIYERLLKQQLEGGIPGQSLLTPERFTLPPTQSEKLREYLNVLRKAGLVISEFGGHDFIIEAVPQFWEQGDIVQRITALLGDLETERTGAQVRKLISEQLVAKVLSRHLIVSTQNLTLTEAEALLTDLLACDLPYTNPDGRPTMVLLSDRDLARRFGRDG